MKPRVAAMVAFSSLMAIGCGESPSDPSGSSIVTWVGTITTAGNITTVVNESGSAWGGNATLVEEASIGVDEGPDEYMLGNIVGIAANDERICLVDASVPIVRIYDYDGRHLMNVGGQGQGPGEYSNPRSAAVAADGTLYVYADRRVNVYSPAGEPITTWPFSTGFESGDPPVLTDDGVLYFHDLVNQPRDVTEMKHGMIAAGEDGPYGEHIPVPDFDFEPYVLVRRFPGGGSMSRNIPFGPQLEWVMAPSGAMIAGVSSDYRFEIHDPDGRATVVEKRWDPLPVADDEAEWHRKQIIDLQRRANPIVNGRRVGDPEWQWDGPPIPDRKPAFAELYAASDGRIWVRRIVTTERLEDCDADPTNPMGDSPRSCWEQIYGFDIFGEDGRFLGSVAAPDNLRARGVVMRGDHLIGYVENDAGVPMVKRYRLVLPGENGP